MNSRDIQNRQITVLTIIANAPPLENRSPIFL